MNRLLRDNMSKVDHESEEEAAHRERVRKIIDEDRDILDDLE